MKIIYPPRPKGKMLWNDLPYYESTGIWVAQRKFRGSNAVIYISPNKEIVLGNRHGKGFANFSLDKSYREEILDSLHFKPGIKYWLNGELMNKDVNAKNEIIFFDVLQVDRYLFGGPTQMDRLNMLTDICGNPTKYCDSKIALEISPRLRLAETFDKDFVLRYKEAIPVPQLEGLVLKKKNSTLDNFGAVEYETSNSIRCRKPFGCDTPREGRSGGYEF